MEVWSGAIDVDSGSSASLTGIRLINPDPTGHSNLSRDAKLSLKAYVNPNRIPIVCFIGPSLELHSSDCTTVDWIRHKLLRTYHTADDGYEQFSSPQQCPVGILVRVNEHIPSPELKAQSAQQEISDILIFGTLSRSSPQNERLSPSYPSSSAAGGQFSGDSSFQLRVYAIPLCSSIFTKAQSISTPPNNAKYNASRNLENEPYGQFMPNIFHSPSPKRKRVTTLFEAATEYHKNVRRKGAAAMSDYLRREKSSTPQLPQLPSNARIKRENENNADIISSLNDVCVVRRRATSIAKDVRVGSRRSSLHRPGSSTSHALSTSSRKELPTSKTDGSSLHLEPGQKPTNPHPDSCEDIAAANKALLTRTILTCMRFYGFRRTNTRSTQSLHSSTRDIPESGDPAIKCDTNLAHDNRVQDVSGPGNLPSFNDIGKLDATNHMDGFDGGEPARPEADGNDDTGFKEMYHATYRASTFALRRFFKPSVQNSGLSGSSSYANDIPVLGKDKAMSTIDSVLKLFCEMSEGE
ncbi:Vacuolar protein sorting-associated protein [Trichophyton interdigitale]|nr:Vacuolar protein sorting-associated protein [Trichophyton interdigitale]